MNLYIIKYIESTINGSKECSHYVVANCIDNAEKHFLEKFKDLNLQIVYIESVESILNKKG